VIWEKGTQFRNSNREVKIGALPAAIRFEK
jgi:hypothetical protein